MVEYILRLFILIPLVGAMAWGSLWLWRRAQLGIPVIPGFSLGAKAERRAQLLDVIPLGTGSRMVVVDFGDRELLVAVTRNQISLLSEHEKGDFHA